MVVVLLQFLQCWLVILQLPGEFHYWEREPKYVGCWEVQLYLVGLQVVNRVALSHRELNCHLLAALELPLSFFILLLRPENLQFRLGIGAATFLRIESLEEWGTTFMENLHLMGWTGSYVKRVYVRYISDEVGKDPQGVAIMHHEILRFYVTWYSLHRNLILLQLRRTSTWHLNGLKCLYLWALSLLYCCYMSFQSK